MYSYTVHKQDITCNTKGETHIDTYTYTHNNRHTDNQQHKQHIHNNRQIDTQHTIIHTHKEIDKNKTIDNTSNQPTDKEKIE